jgi:hypothetical protein
MIAFLENNIIKNMIIFYVLQLVRNLFNINLDLINSMLLHKFNF